MSFESVSSNGSSYDGTGFALKKTAKIFEVGGNWSPCPSFRFRRPWYFYMEARALSMRRERIPILSVLAFVRAVFKIEKEHVLNPGQVTACSKMFSSQNMEFSSL